MRQITVTGPFVQLHHGKLRLTEDQSRARSHALKRVDGDLFEIVEPVGFKRGESFGFDGPVDKSYAAYVEDPKAPEEGLEDELEIEVEDDSKAKADKPAKAKAKTGKKA